jgi:hypothetical protein
VEEKLKTIVLDFESRVRAYIKENFETLDFKETQYDVEFLKEGENSVAVVTLMITGYGKQVFKIVLNGTFVNIMAKAEIVGKKKLPTTFFTDLTTEIMAAWSESVANLSEDVPISTADMPSVFDSSVTIPAQNVAEGDAPLASQRWGTWPKAEEKI